MLSFFKDVEEIEKGIIQERQNEQCKRDNMARESRKIFKEFFEKMAELQVPMERCGGMFNAVYGYVVWEDDDRPHPFVITKDYQTFILNLSDHNFRHTSFFRLTRPRSSNLSAQFFGHNLAYRLEKEVKARL